MLKISKLFSEMFSKRVVIDPKFADSNPQADSRNSRSKPISLAWSTCPSVSPTLNFTGYIYKEPNGWSWDIFANNGRCVARSGHPFKRKNECRLGLQRFINKAAATRIKE